MCFHTSLTHTCDRVLPASLWIWPAAYVCVSMRITAYCMCMHMFMRVCACHCRWYSRMCQLCTSVLQGKMYRESKSVRGMEVTQAFFSIAKTLLSISRPSVQPYKQMSGLELQKKKHHTIIYWEYNIGWRSNELLPEGCLGYASSLWHMKEKYMYMRYTLLHYLFCFVYFSQDACSGSEAPLLLRELRYTVRAIFHLFFHLLSATSSSFKEWNIN